MLRRRALAFESLEQRQLLAASNIFVDKYVLNIRGTDGNDVIAVEPLNAQNPYTDYLVTLNGQTTICDTMNGSVRDIHIFGLAGDDQVTINYAVTAYTQIHGGLGNDTITGSREVFGEAGDDTIIGTNSIDKLDGGIGNDTIDSLANDDVIHGGKGNDTLYGGDGNDQLFGDAGDDQMDGGNHADKVYGGAGNDTLIASDFDQLVGGAGADILDASGAPAGSDLRGEAGNDILYGGSGGDNLDGGAGIDLISGGGGNDSISGDAGNDQLDGGSGDDRIYAGAGNDQVQGGDGVDELYGEAGNDTIFGDGNADEVDGGKGKDDLHGGDGNDQLLGGAGVDRLNGDAGDNLLDSTDRHDLLLNGLSANLHNELRATLASPYTEYGYATYNLHNTGGQLTATLEIHFSYIYYPDPVPFDFYIDGVLVAHTNTDQNRTINLTFSNDPSANAQPFPANFPALSAGSIISVGSGDIQGKFSESFFI